MDMVSVVLQDGQNHHQKYPLAIKRSYTKIATSTLNWYTHLDSILVRDGVHQGIKVKCQDLLS